ncbi:MAG: transcription termination/antitermination protein NusA [Kiritimatiellae bacterium]|nr:transcription termination/antitermination protein NusA [Kiritimatiellia bacterium]
MNNELDTILRTLERERGIGRGAMLNTIANALQAAAKKSLATSGDVRVEIDPHTLAIGAWERRVVSDEATGTGYVSLAVARKTKPDAVPGDTIETPVDPRVFGRIAAQTAKQAIIQGMHESERDIMLRRYSGHVGEIVTAVVRQVSHKDALCDLVDGGEAILKGRDRMKNDRLSQGDSFRAVIRFVGTEQDPRRLEDGEEPGQGTWIGRRRVKMIDEPAGNPCVKLSRTDPSFVRALFAEQSSEIKDGTVEIVEIARQAGIRTKMAVRSRTSKIDPVGACVGARGARIRQVISELNGEKIDIVPWNEDIEKFAVAALAPATVQRVEIDRSRRLVTAYVQSGGLTPAIGKGGINTRLASELIGWDVSVRELDAYGETADQRRSREEAFQAGLKAKIATLAETLGVPAASAEAAAAHGFLSAEGIIETTLAEFVAQLADSGNGDMPTLAEPEARTVWLAAERSLLESLPANDAPSADAADTAPDGEPVA